MLEHRVEAAAEKQVKGFLQADLDPTAGQGLAQAAAAQDLAVDQHAIAVENDEMGPHHRLGEKRSMRSYTPKKSNCPI